MMIVDRCRSFLRPSAKLALVLAALVSCLIEPARAQIPGGQSGFNPALLQLFGNHRAFTGSTELRMLDRANTEVLKMPMSMQYLDGKVRAEVNLNTIKASELGEQSLALYKKAGMEQITSILRPDRKNSIVAFQPAKVLVQQAMSAEDSAAFSAKYTVKLTEVGRETIDSHPCVKNQVTVTSSTGQAVQGLVWHATDLKQFPVKITLSEGDSSVEMKFLEVKLQKPESTAFEAPNGHTRFDSMEQLIQNRLASFLPGAK